MRFISFLSKPILAVFLILVLFLPACASRGGKTYNDYEVRQAQTVTFGTVLSATQVSVEDDPNGTGAVAGGLAGGILGSLLGGGSGHVVGALGGAALGAIGGTLIEKEARSYNAVEITVSLDNKAGIVSIVQGNDEIFVKGDKVRILTTQGGRSRVQHYR